MIETYWRESLGQHGHAGIGHGMAEILACDGLDGGLYAFIAHHVGVLRHGAQQVSRP